MQTASTGSIFAIGKISSRMPCPYGKSAALQAPYFISFNLTVLLQKRSCSFSVQQILQTVLLSAL